MVILRALSFDVFPWRLSLDEETYARQRNA
jgi:hypothetical protein